MSAIKDDDEKLLAEWYAARGAGAPRVSADDEAVILRALRGRQDEIEHPQALAWCAECRANARGPHRAGAAGYLR